MNLRTLTQPLIVFYLLAGFVLLFVFWWSYHLLDIHREVFELQTQVLEPQHLDLIRNDYHRKLLMVYSEGAVFFILLAIGIWQVRQSFRRKIQLAQQQRNFLLSITHELKSPLASIKLAIQTLFKRSLPREKVLELSEVALADADRLDVLLDNMLLAAKLEGHNYLYQSEQVDFSALVTQVAEKSLSPLKMDLALEIQDQLVLNGDPMALSSLAANLIDNAIKYSEPGSPIKVKLIKEKNELVLEVIDIGLGVINAEKEKIFEKFYRIGNEETRQTKGTGLGLYIVRTIASAHLGKVQHLDNKPRGSRFQVRFTLPENLD